MMARYEVDEGRCQEDVLDFLNDLASDGTIRIVEDAD